MSRPASLPRFVIPCVASLTLLVHASSAGAAEPSHQGLFLRLTTGLGGAVTSLDDEPELELRGLAGFFSFDLGGTLTHGLALHGRLSAHNLVNPSVSLAGDDLGELSDVSLSYGLFGIGITYYFPSNLYLTGVVGASSARLEIDDDEYDSETGVGLNLDLGYEWSVGGDWGLGIAARLEHHSIPTDTERLIGNAFGILFSATCH
jgi:hypothetical protein